MSMRQPAKSLCLSSAMVGKWSHFFVLIGCRNVVTVLEARHAGAIAVASAPPGLQPPDIERGAELVRTVTAGGRSVMSQTKASQVLAKIGLE